MPAYEAIGYAASILVAVSLTMSNVMRLRWVNLAGAVFFTAYGALVGAWPVFAVNLFIAGVDLYYLVQMTHRRDFFTLLPARAQDALVRKFLLFYRADIARFFPNATAEALAGVSGFFVLRNLLPVGLFFYRPSAGGQVEIVLDYVIPEYRDRKNAEFVFRILNEKLGAEGLQAFVIKSSVPEHQRYLLREGFAPDQSAPELFCRAII